MGRFRQTEGASETTMSLERPKNLEDYWLQQPSGSGGLHPSHYHIDGSSARLPSLLGQEQGWASTTHAGFRDLFFEVLSATAGLLFPFDAEAQSAS